MRIVVATPLYPPEPGGPATYAKLLEEGLPERGIEMSLITFGAVKHLPKGIRHLAYFWRVLSAARGADLIYALDASSVGFPAMLAATFARKPLVVKIVGDAAWEQGRQRFGVTQTLDEFVRESKVPPALVRLRRMQARVAMRAKIVVVPSRYLKGIVQAWGIPEEKIVVIWNAIQEEPAGDAPQMIAALPKPLIVSVGRLVPWKGFSELIEAVRMVRERGISASLAIAGDGPERDRLEKEAREKLAGGFAFAGALPHAHTLSAMREADVFVLDSAYEGLSHVLIEALDSGAAIVASDIPGNREVIEHEKNGLLVRPGDVDALAHALERLLSHEPLRAQLAAAAKKRARDFSRQSMLDAVAALLNTI